jgi:hypothetical protein
VPSRVEPAAGEPYVDPAVADLMALCDRHAETGEFYSYDPETRKAEVYAPAKRSWQLVEVLDVAALHLSRTTVVHAPPRRQNRSHGRERRAQTRRTSPSRGDPDPEPEPPLRVIPHATFARVLRHALGEQA